MLKKYQFAWNYDVGMDVSLDYMKQYFDVRFVADPLWLTKNLVYIWALLPLPMTLNANSLNLQRYWKDGEWQDDFCHRGYTVCLPPIKMEKTSVFLPPVHITAYAISWNMPRN